LRERAVRYLFRFPEVGLLAGLDSVEGDKELVEDTVLPAVPALIFTEGGSLADRTREIAVDRPGGEQAAVCRQVNTGGEHRVNEAGRVSDKYHARPPEAGIAVRIVLAYTE